MIKEIEQSINFAPSGRPDGIKTRLILSELLTEGSIVQNPTARIEGASNDFLNVVGDPNDLLPPNPVHPSSMVQPVKPSSDE